MARHKNSNWTFPTSPHGEIETWEQAGIAVLMDIRDELQALNRLLGCKNFTDIPEVLRAIRRNTTKPKRRKRG